MPATPRENDFPALRQSVPPMKSVLAMSGLSGFCVLNWAHPSCPPAQPAATTLRSFLEATANATSAPPQSAYACPVGQLKHLGPLHVANTPFGVYCAKAKSLSALMTLPAA